MAQQLSASIYGKDGYAWIGSNGTTKSFPTQSISIQALPANQVYAGVTCVSVIQLLPTGLTVGVQNFYCPTAAATLITNSNA